MNQQPICIHCGKPKSLHKAKTLECPFGKPSRSIGYTAYGPTSFRAKAAEVSCQGDPMTTPSERLQHFADVWDQLKPSPEVYGLEMGHPERESALTTTDLRSVLAEVKAWQQRFPDLEFTNCVDGIQPKC